MRQFRLTLVVAAPADNLWWSGGGRRAAARRRPSAGGGRRGRDGGHARAGGEPAAPARPRADTAGPTRPAAARLGGQSAVGCRGQTRWEVSLRRGVCREVRCVRRVGTDDTDSAKV